MEHSEWIITPKLQRTVYEFIRLYSHLKSKSESKIPIMILGDRGVGKSLFVHIYKTLYERDNLGKTIIRLNAASLTETIVDSELFGHKKGSFTGAIENKPGLVEKADLLILEEIGELPHYVQAKLLTFLEDKKFRSLGDTEEKKAKKNLQIIATTNKKQKDMRPDFYDRFVKITVPPLYQRRMDVLYYIAWYAPKLLKDFHPWEILTLLTYPWHGNVRELQAACLDMELNRDCYDDDDYYQPNSISYVKKEHTNLNYRTCIEHYTKMKKNGIDVELLEKILNKWGLGFDWDNMKKPFAKLNFIEEEREEWDAIFKTKTLRGIKEFYSVRGGLLLYCKLFHKDWFSSSDLLSSSSSIKPSAYSSPYLYTRNFLVPDYMGCTHRHEELAKDILEHVFEIKIPKDLRKKSLLIMDEPEFKGEYAEWLYQVHAAAQNESNLSDAMSGAKEPQANPLDMKEEDLLRSYYKHLLQKTGGNKKLAAVLADMKYKTFCSRLKKIKMI